MDDVRRLIDNLEVVYGDFITLLSTNPDAEPRYSFESELRAAYYAILSARESLGRTVSRLNPRTMPPDGVELPAPTPAPKGNRGRV